MRESLLEPIKELLHEFGEIGCLKCISPDRKVDELILTLPISDLRMNAPILRIRRRAFA